HPAIHERRCDDLSEVPGRGRLSVAEDLDVHVRRQHVHRSDRAFRRDRAHLRAAVRLDHAAAEVAGNVVALEGVELLAAYLDEGHARASTCAARSAYVPRELVNGGRCAPHEIGLTGFEVACSALELFRSEIVSRDK